MAPNIAVTFLFTKTNKTSCRDARKTLKTGWRGVCLISESQLSHVFYRASLFSRFSLCQRQDSTKENLTFVG
jgi:hypothetical protein